MKSRRINKTIELNHLGHNFKITQLGNALDDDVEIYKVWIKI